MTDFDPLEGTEAVGVVVENLTKVLEKMGVYVNMVSVDAHGEPDKMELVNVGTLSIREAVWNHDIEMAFQLVVSLGDLALSDKFLYPEQQADMQEFLKIAPLETEIAMEQMLSELAAEINDEEED